MPPASLPARKRCVLTSSRDPVNIIAGKFAGGFNMSLAEAKTLQFFPGSGPVPGAEHAGFRFGSKGTHSSRTLMFTDLEAVLAATTADAARDAYAKAIIEGNCLQKATTSTRRISNQRLGELFGLDRGVALFRVLRRLWSVADDSRPLLALLMALARDPLLIASAEPVLTLPVGAELQRAPLRDALRRVVGDRMNDDVLDKVVRNTASTWTQTGHLEGRTFKIRKRAQADAPAVAFALYVGHAAGFRGEALLTTGWVAALDCTASSAKSLALQAKRVGLIDLRVAGDVTEFGLDRLDPAMGRT